LVLIGINATIVVHAPRSSRIDDDIAITFGDDVCPCEATSLFELAPLRVAILDELQPAPIVVREDAVIALAPKTSPPV
jgi:hypothetical protein